MPIKNKTIKILYKTRINQYKLINNTKLQHSNIKISLTNNNRINNLIYKSNFKLKNKNNYNNNKLMEIINNKTQFNNQ